MGTKSSDRESRVLFPGSRKTKRPRMTEHRGRTWDRCEGIAADGSRRTGYYDTSWGAFFYWPWAVVNGAEQV